MDTAPEHTHLAANYGFIELPAVDGHRNFILEQLKDRYLESRDKEAFIIILHRNDTEHFIMGVYDDLREALQTRFVSNSILGGGEQFSQGNFMMTHHISGPPIEDKIFDAVNNSIKDFNVKPKTEE